MLILDEFPEEEFSPTVNVGVCAGQDLTGT